MKKYLFLLVGGLLSVGTAFSQVTYCTGGPSSAADSELASATLLGQTTNISYQQICPGTIGVNNQRALHSADLVIGLPYTLNLSFGTCGGNFTNMASAYIDWDGNGTFDPSEAIGTSAATPVPFTGAYTFTVPPTAVPGTTVLRVLQWETSGQTLPLNPCATMTWGSMTDFSIVVIPPGPCTNAAVNNATTTATQVCVGIGVNLGATGVSFGTGTTYQWQVSTDSINFTNIPGATTVNYPTGPLSATAFYRLQVTCGASVANSVPVKVTVIGTPLAAGTYTINSALPTGGTNFQTFNALFTQVNCGGLAGPVVVNVAPNSGPYNEQVLIGSIGGASAINTLTINGNGEVLEFSNTNNNQRATLTIEGSSFVTINNLTIKALPTGTHGYGVQLRNGANNIVVKNSTIESTTSSTSTNFAGIVLNSGLTATANASNFPFDNTIDSNTVIGGYYGISLVANGSANKASNNKVRFNNIQDFYLYGLYSSAQEDFQYIGNDINRATRTTISTFYGIFFTQEHFGGTISLNSIHNPCGGNPTSTSTLYPFYSSSASGSTAKPNNVFNNRLYNLNGYGTLYAMWNASSNFWNYYHNSLHVDNTLPTAALTYMVYFSGTSNDVNFRNNIVSMRRSGTSAKYAIYVTGSGTKNINNNAYYVDYTVGSNPAVGFISSARVTMVDWVSNNGNNWDINSVFADPNFLAPSTGQLIPVAASLINDIGTNLLSVVPTDYTGAARTATPDPGAYEFTIGPCTNAFGGVSTANPTQICLNGSTTLTTSGFSFGLGTKYQWQVSIKNGPWTNLVNDTLPNAVASPADTASFRLRVICGTDTSFSTPTATVNVLGTPLAAGTYTINQLGVTAGTNFASFSDFFTGVNCGGISGPVVLNVVPGTGPYIEQVLIGNIGGTSAINTLTINGNGEVLEFAVTNDGQRGVLTFDNVSHVTVNGLIIRVLAASTRGYGVQMRNGANNNVLRTCQIEVPQTTTSSLYGGVILNNGLSATTSAAGFPFNNTIDSNVITGGYYGATLMGNGIGNRAVGNKFLNNTFREFYFYGIYSSAQEDYEYKGNTFSRPTRTPLSSFYGIFCTSDHHGGDISRNAFHDPFGAILTSTSAFYGIYSSSASGTAAKPNNVYNNIMYNINSFGTVYGMWAATSNFWNYYHNSIHVDDITPTAALTYLMYTSGTSNDIDIRNNVFSLRRSGTSAKYLMYISGTGTKNINNNAYYVDYTQGNTNFGFITAAIANFNDWRTTNGNGWDNFSTFDAPNFLFAPGGLLIPSAGSYDNIGANLLSIVPTDYLDTARTTTPDPGAFEFQGPACSNPVAFDTTGITSTSISLGWSQPGASVNTWDIEWGPRGFTPGTTGNNQVTITTNPYTLSNLTPGTCYDVYIRANCNNINLGLGAWVGPVEVCLPWTFDISVDALVNPVSPTGCGDSAMAVSVLLFNNGETAATNVALAASVTGMVTQTLTFTYPGPLAPYTADTVVIGTINTYAGGTLNVSISNNWTLDQNPVNDTLSKNNINILPAVPTAFPAFACAAQDSVTLAMQAAPGASFLWFSQPAGGTPIHVGDSFKVATTAAGPYYVEYQSGVVGSLPTTTAGGNSCGAGNMFDLVPARTMSITGFDIVPVASSATHAVQIYMVAASHTTLTSQVGWTLVHSTTINATANQLATVTLPNPVMLNANQTYGFYVQHNASYTSAANTFSNADLTFISGNGNCSAFDYCCTPRTFNGAIHYEISGCQSPRVPVSATVYQDTALAAFTANQTGPGDFSFNATGSTGHLFNWFFGDGNTGNGINTTHTYGAAGSFAVTLVVTDTVCGSVDSLTINVTSTISLEEFLINQNLRVYPNPSSGVFNIEFDMEGVKDLYVRIISPTGQRIFEENAGRNASTYRKAIDLNAYARGIYILQIQTENGIVSRRLSLI